MTETDPTPGQDGEQEPGPGPDTVEYWRARSRDHERRAKANADAARSLGGLTEERDRLRLELDETRQRLDDIEHGALRAQVAAAHRLPAALAERLVGTTREELEADAQRLLGALGDRSPGRGDGRPKPAIRKVPVPDQNHDDDGAQTAAREWMDRKLRRT